MNERKVYGYARVSTKEQNEDRQLLALLEYGVLEKNIFVDKQSGKDFNRPKYRQLVKKMRPGDTLINCHRGLRHSAAGYAPEGTGLDRHLQGRRSCARRRLSGCARLGASKKSPPDVPRNSLGSRQRPS